MVSLPSINIWRLVIDNFGLNGMNGKKLGLKKQGKLQRKNLAQFLALFQLSLVVLFLIARMVLIKRMLSFLYQGACASIMC
jgi:hypothetical protein